MKTFLKIISFVLLAAVTLSLSACSNTYSEAEMTQFLNTAVQNACAEDFYYFKETTANVDGKALYRTVNVLTDIDGKYEPVTDENGNHTTLRVSVSETLGGKNRFSAICGLSSGVNSGDAQKDYLFVTRYDANGTETEKQKTEMSAQAYLESTLFEAYRLDTVLHEVARLTAADMDFTCKNGGLEEKGNVRKFTFSIRPEYLQRYKQEFGTDSAFADTTTITIETAFDRVSEVVTYCRENLDSNFSIETEKYKLQIVYLGPKFSVPSYNAVGADSQEIWKTAEMN